jgi:hypothetical protein
MVRQASLSEEAVCCWIIDMTTTISFPSAYDSLGGSEGF